MEHAEERLTSPAAARNLQPILAVLAARLPSSGRVLEVASGPGQHVVAFAAAMPSIEWLPSDSDSRALASIRAWTAHEGVDNVAPPRPIDVARAGWDRPLERNLDAVIAINLLHIAPWSAAVGLMDGASSLLAEHGELLVYGPFKRSGVHTAPSNEAFDRSLRAQDPAWGVRDLDAVGEAAAQHGLAIADTVEMPSNNLVVACRRTD